MNEGVYIVRYSGFILLKEVDIAFEKCFSYEQYLLLKLYDMSCMIFYSWRDNYVENMFLSCGKRLRDCQRLVTSKTEHE
jgi:hypothetical protein